MARPVRFPPFLIVLNFFICSFISPLVYFMALLVRMVREPCPRKYSSLFFIFGAFVLFGGFSLSSSSPFALYMYSPFLLRSNCRAGETPAVPKSSGISPSRPSSPFALFVLYMFSFFIVVISSFPHPSHPWFLSPRPGY
jgi:hypothetical protein